MENSSADFGLDFFKLQVTTFEVRLVSIKHSTGKLLFRFTFRFRSKCQHWLTKHGKNSLENCLLFILLVASQNVHTYWWVIYNFWIPCSLLEVLLKLSECCPSLPLKKTKTNVKGRGAEKRSWLIKKIQDRNYSVHIVKLWKYFSLRQFTF